MPRMTTVPCHFSQSLSGCHSWTCRRHGGLHSLRLSQRSTLFPRSAGQVRVDVSSADKMQIWQGADKERLRRRQRQRGQDLHGIQEPPVEQGAAEEVAEERGECETDDSDVILEVVEANQSPAASDEDHNVEPEAERRSSRASSSSSSSSTSSSSSSSPQGAAAPALAALPAALEAAGGRQVHEESGAFGPSFYITKVERQGQLLRSVQSARGMHRGAQSRYHGGDQKTKQMP